MGDPLKNMHRSIWKKAQEEDPYREVEAEDVTDVIHENQGYDRRTVNKWWRLLRQKGVIEEVPRLGRYKVEEPEGELIESVGNITKKRVNIDSELVEGAENLGIELSALLNEALASEVASQREYVSKLLDQSFSEAEADYVFEIVKNNLFKKSTRPEVEAKVDDQRRNIYKDVFGVDNISEDEYEHLDNLRKRAFDAAESLGVQSP